MFSFNKEKLIGYIENLSTPRILIIGDMGIDEMIYGDTEWLVKRIDVSKFNSSCIWLADEADIPKYPYRYEMWQYTTQGQVAGINGFVDLNISFVDYSAR